MESAVNLHIIAAVLLCFTAVTTQNLKTFTAIYGPFNSSGSDMFQMENAASISNGALQLTPDTFVDEKVLLGSAYGDQSGRVMLKQRFKLWAEEEGRVASFNSSFLFNIYAFNDTPWGEGLAFVLAPNFSLPSNSFGQYLGLTNYSTDNTENSLVAIEFDTVKEHFDPDANHVGLNLNSIISTVNVSLTPLGIELAPQGKHCFYNVWVQYDGVKKSIEVYIAQQPDSEGDTPSRPDKPVLQSNLDLRDVLQQDTYFGFSASTGNNKQLNSILRWNLTAEYYHYNPEDIEPLWYWYLLGIAGGLLVIRVAVAGCYNIWMNRTMAQSESKALVGVLKRLPGTPREFQFKDLVKATNNFDEKNKLGQGGFGAVYRGHLQNENLEVAIKRFSRDAIKSQDDFLAELTVINRLRHKHLVRLLGWCHKKGKLLLVYDYMPNGSLDRHLFTRTLNNKPLSWDLRYKIISGVALALHYLHNEYEQKVIHRDIKASNIMLDSNFNARLGDFGLARALDTERTSYTEAGGVAGTLGYIAPECFHTGKASQQSDVYAFGVVLLEIVCGSRLGTTIDEFDCLIDWVRSLHREGQIVDAVEERLGDEYVVEEAKKVLLLALACTHPLASERPKTQAIVEIISGVVPMPSVPPFKPGFVWAMPSLEDDDINGSVTTRETRTFPMTYLESGVSPQYISQELYTNDKFRSA